MTRLRFVRVVLKWLLRLRAVWVGLFVSRLGVVVGQAMLSPKPEAVTGIVLALPYVILISLSPVSGLMAWVVSQPFLEGVVNIPMGEGIPDLSLTRLCVGCLFTLLMAQMAIRKRQISRLEGVDMAGLLFILGIGQSAFNATDSIATMQTIIDMHIVPLLAYFIAKNVVDGRRELHRVITILTLAGAVIGAYAMYEQVTGHILFRPESCDLECAASSNYTTTLRILRGIFGGPGTFGLVLTQLIPIGFLLFFRARNVYTRFFYGLALVAMIGGNYATFRRTAWIAMIVSFFILQWFYPQFRRLFIVLVVIMGIVAAVYWEPINQSEVVQGRVNDGLDTANGRTEMWATMQRMWQAKPVFGWGYAQYQNYSIRFRRDGVHENFTNTQSLYWTILVSGGLVAFLPLVGIFLSLLFTSVRLFRQPDGSGLIRPEFIAVFWAVMAAYLINNYTVHDVSPFGHLLLYVIAGAFVGAPERLRLAARSLVSSGSVALPPAPRMIIAANRTGSEV